jgi:hypothetical protein
MSIVTGAAKALVPRKGNANKIAPEQTNRDLDFIFDSVVYFLLARYFAP